MSRKGCTHDNIMIEIFFGRLKQEMFYGEKRSFKSLSERKEKIEDYIIWYNQKRISNNLNNMSPVNYRNSQVAILSSS